MKQVRVIQGGLSAAVAEDQDAIEYERPLVLPDTVRKLSRPAFEDLALKPIPTGEPRFERLKPEDLLVDETYQRDLTEKGLKLIRNIAENWDWRTFKPPIIAWTERGFEILDGQHTATAALLRNDIVDLPVIVIEAAEIAERAASFVGHNANRLAVTPVQLYLAALTAKDPEALLIQQVCEEAGVTIVRPSGNPWAPGQSIAIQVISSLVRRRKRLLSVEILSTLARAEVMPISAPAIKAAEMLFTDSDYADQFEPEDMVIAIKTLGESAYRAAKTFAAAQAIPVWQGLAVQWFKKVKKRSKR